MEVDRRAWNVRVAKPMSVTSALYTSDDTLLPDLTETYHIERIPIQMQDMRCVVEAAIWSELWGIDKTKATVYAIFQRDIAEMFKEDGWSAWDV